MDFLLREGLKVLFWSGPPYKPRNGRNKVIFTNLTIVFFKALQITKIGLVTPYIGAVNNILIDYIQQHGYLVTNLTSFDLIHDSDVASVSCNSIIVRKQQLVETLT